MSQILFIKGGLRSTEVTILLLTQQSLVQFSAVPKNYFDVAVLVGGKH